MDAYDANNELDRIIRRKVDAIRPDFRPGSWDQLSARLDEADATDDFDQEMSQRLRRMHVPYQPNSWAALAARLELERSRVRAVGHYKLMELSLLLLLFITAWQHLPFVEDTPIATPPPGVPFAEMTPAEDVEDYVLETTTPITPGHERQSNSTDSETAASNEEQATGTAPMTFSNLIAARIGNGTYPEPRTPVVDADPLPTNELEGIAYETDAQAQLKQFFAEKTEDLTTPTDVFQQEGALAALAGGETALLDYGDPNELLEFIRPVERKTFLRIGFVGSPDYNRIITPAQELETGSIGSFDRYSIGYSGGLTLGIEHGKWEIETGASYAARRYQAVPTIYVTGTLRDGYQGLGLRDFELNTINIPLDFRYNLLLRDKWRIYTQAGASLNLVLGANYFLSDEETFTGVPVASAGSNPDVSAADKPRPLQEKTLTEGWLEGGSFWDNATIYSNFGMGLERYMTPNWSMFVQPTYRHALPLFNDGLGPYDDTIHNFGIGMGVKVRL